MAESAKRNITWGTAILASFLVVAALMVMFGMAPSQFITRVTKSYARIQDSRQSRFTRDMVSANYYVVVSVWLVIGAYHIQKLARRDWRLIAWTVLLGLPCIVFAVVPEILHGFINAWVNTRPEAERSQALYDADLWIYTMYWAAGMGLFFLLTPGWIFGLKKIEERFGDERPARESAFGRPVVTTPTSTSSPS